MTLIEIMIALVIFALTLALAAPHFRVWIQNIQIRNVAESIQNGLRVARNEALRRDTRVEFALGSGSSWKVYVPAASETVQERASDEGSTANVTLSMTPGGATTVTFSGLGRVIANVDGSATLTQVDLDSSAISATQSHDLRVLINSGGQIKMCDPNVTTTTDPRYCTS